MLCCAVSCCCEASQPHKGAGSMTRTWCGAAPCLPGAGRKTDPVTAAPSIPPQCAPHAAQTAAQHSTAWHGTACYSTAHTACDCCLSSQRCRRWVLSVSFVVNSRTHAHAATEASIVDMGSTEGTSTPAYLPLARILLRPRCSSCRCSCSQQATRPNQQAARHGSPPAKCGTHASMC